MPVSTTDAAHLLRRAGFGVTPARLAEITALALSRQPSSEAYANRLSQLRAGRSFRAVAAEFFGSRECAQRFG